jgi:hypothetical protein
MALMGSSPVLLPRLTTNLRKQYRGPSTPLSKHCKGLRMQQRKQRLLPRSLDPGSYNTIASCEHILIAPQGQEAKEN